MAKKKIAIVGYGFISGKGYVPAFLKRSEAMWRWWLWPIFRPPAACHWRRVLDLEVIDVRF